MPDAGLDSANIQWGNGCNPPMQEAEHQTRHREQDGDSGTEGGVVCCCRVVHRWAVHSCPDLQYDTDYHHPEQDGCQHMEGEMVAVVDTGGRKGAAV